MGLQEGKHTDPDASSRFFGGETPDGGNGLTD